VLEARGPVRELEHVMHRRPWRRGHVDYDAWRSSERLPELRLEATDQKPKHERPRIPLATLDKTKRHGLPPPPSAVPCNHEAECREREQSDNRTTAALGPELGKRHIVTVETSQDRLVAIPS
jgi:hypothetical protein